jgi:hypothetical protein
MRRLLVFVLAALFAARALCAAAADQPWTFCVASAPASDEVWITDVFAAGRDRVKLEADLKTYLKTRGVLGAVAQCPLPNSDKTAAINAQFAAAEFNRKLGHALHEVAAPEFEPRR